MSATDALMLIIVRCPDLLRQATDALRAWRVNSPIREQRLARAITDALREYGAAFSAAERAALLALLPEQEAEPTRTRTVIARVSPAEKARVAADAAAAGQTVSDYIRARIGL